MAFHTNICGCQRQSTLKILKIEEWVIPNWATEKPEFAALIIDEIWYLKLAYLSDIFEHLNSYNASMLGRKKTFLHQVTNWMSFSENSNM